MAQIAICRELRVFLCYFFLLKYSSVLYFTLFPSLRWATLGPAVARADDGRPADNGPLLIGQQVEVVAALVEETAGEVVVVVTTVVTVVEVDDGALVSWAR